MSIETAKAISNLAPDCRLVAIREQDAEIERLRASRDDWMNACNRAQEHRDGANAQLTIFESENLQLRNEIERLRAERDDNAWWRKELADKLHDRETQISNAWAALRAAGVQSETNLADAIALAAKEK